MMDNTKRFSNRVEDYVKYRPHYPAEIIGYLQREHALDTRKIIADIGAGTGISTELFLQAGYYVFAVEPNNEMRRMCSLLLNSFPGFEAVNGTAEDTALQSKSIDAIIAGQAFHWFDRQKAKIEFNKILKNDGIVVLMWNERQIESSFEKDYDRLIIKNAKDYVEVGHRNINDHDIAAFFTPETFKLKTFQNSQIFDFDGLKGRLQSSSYMPVKGQEGFDEMIKDLQDLFNQYEENGLIKISYQTKVYTGKL